jgi:hypothetical protein
MGEWPVLPTREAEMSESKKVVYCKISTWAGQVIGAEHYYVDFEQRYGETVNLYHKITASEAARLNRRREESVKWEAGEDIGYFFSRERAVREAILSYKLAFPGAVILVEGEPGTYEPRPILDGPPEAMEVINNLVELAEAIDWWEEDESAMQVIQDAWKEIWIPEFEKE